MVLGNTMLKANALYSLRVLPDPSIKRFARACRLGWQGSRCTLVTCPPANLAGGYNIAYRVICIKGPWHTTWCGGTGGVRRAKVDSNA